MTKPDTKEPKPSAPAEPCCKCENGTKARFIRADLAKMEAIFECIGCGAEIKLHIQDER